MMSNDLLPFLSPSTRYSGSSSTIVWAMVICIGATGENVFRGHPFHTYFANKTDEWMQSFPNLHEHFYTNVVGVCSLQNSRVIQLASAGNAGV